MTSDSKERERGTFQDVAKLATMPEPATRSTEETKENSGMIDLGALASGESSPPSSQPVSSQRVSASSPPVTPRSPISADFKAMAAETPPGWIPAPVPTAPWLPMVGSPSPPLAAPRSPSPPTNLAAAAPEPHFFPHPDPLPLETTRPTSMSDDDMPLPKRGSATVWIALGGGMALGALAAGAFFGMHGSARPQAGGTVAAAPLQSTWVQPTSPPNDTKTAMAVPAPEEHAVQPSVPSAPTVDKHAKTFVPAAHALNSPPPSQAGALAAADEAAPTPAVPAAALLTTTPSAGAPVPGSDQSLEALMRKAVGTPADRPVPRSQPAPSSAGAEAPASNGNLPVKPAIGAVQGALGTVLPAARYCLGPDDPVSRAAITFKSDGSVQSVGVMGDAAGQPAEGCIRSRLMAARVPPFSSPTFTWTVTVRPAN